VARRPLMTQITTNTATAMPITATVNAVAPPQLKLLIS
jgi:hypothetical protein